MIQRIQSVYLLLTTVISLLFLKGGIIIFRNDQGELFKLTFSEIVKVAGTSNEPLGSAILVSIFIILIPVIALIAIFLFRNRKIQLLITGILIALTVLFIAACCYYSSSIMTKYHASLVPGIKMFLPVILLILSVLAYRGIKKDEELVRSYDRLR